MSTKSTQRYEWKALSFASGFAAAFAVRTAAKRLWQRGRHAEPPVNPAAGGVSWQDALIWAVSVGVGAAVAKVVAQRTAAAVWTAATGTAPPDLED